MNWLLREKVALHMPLPGELQLGLGNLQAEVTRVRTSTGDEGVLGAIRRNGEVSWVITREDDHRLPVRRVVVDSAHTDNPVIAKFEVRGLGHSPNEVPIKIHELLPNGSQAGLDLVGRLVPNDTPGIITRPSGQVERGTIHGALLRRAR